MNGEREVNIGVLVRQKGGFPQEEDGLGGHRGVGEYFLVESSRLGVRLAERTLTDCQLVGEDAGQNRRHSWVRVPVHAPVRCMFSTLKSDARVWGTACGSGVRHEWLNLDLHLWRSLI